MNLATWNLSRGAAEPLWPVLQSVTGADLLFLQECPDPGDERAVWEPTPREWKKEIPWGSAVISSSGTVLSQRVEGYEGWVVGGEVVDAGINRNGQRLFAFSIHAPTGSKESPRGSYVGEVGIILDHLAKQVPAGADLIIAGDFNFKSLGLRPNGKPFPTTDEELNGLRKFEEHNLTSCWASAHPGEPLAQTLRWTGNRATPYHCDGIFVPKRWPGPIVSEVLTSSIFTDSDHYPVAAWIPPFTAAQLSPA